MYTYLKEELDFGTPARESLEEVTLTIDGDAGHRRRRARR